MIELRKVRVYRLVVPIVVFILGVQLLLGNGESQLMLLQQAVFAGDLEKVEAILSSKSIDKQIIMHFAFHPSVSHQPVIDVLRKYVGDVSRQEELDEQMLNVLTASDEVVALRALDRVRSLIAQGIQPGVGLRGFLALVRDRDDQLAVYAAGRVSCTKKIIDELLACLA